MLLYVGPNGQAVSAACEASGFTGLREAPSVEAAVAGIRSREDRPSAVLLDTAIDRDALEEAVAFTTRSYPEVVIALAGYVAGPDRKRLDLLGVALELNEVPTGEQMDALARLAGRSRRRTPGGDDWSVRVERGSWVEISVPSKEVYVSRIQELVGVLEKTKLDADTRDELMLAIDELVRNAMEWGNRYDASRRVLVSYYCTDDRIVIRVEDEGEGFDHAGAADPTEDLKAHGEARAAEGKRAGGYGIHLIRNLMDEVIYNEKGNVVMLTKFLDTDGG